MNQEVSRGVAAVHLNVRQDRINNHKWDAEPDLLVQPISFKTLTELQK